jgi:DNA repair photolyase
MTLTTLDEGLCKILEPNVSTTLGRVEALKAMREAGIPTIVWLGPLLPFISDNEENLRGIMDYCVQAGVVGILCFGFGMTLRTGSREYFYKKLDEHFPGMKQQYINSFGNSYHCGSPNNAKLMEIFTETCRKRGIMCSTNDVFGYLRQFETMGQHSQLFDWSEER